ncbi:heterokaryon incompatibility protein-domain-containing protein, partial [Podospora australis]
MWLINCRSHPLTLVQVKGRIPDYAILSHTWGSDEVTFQDFSDIPKRTTQEGFQKIQKTCRQAVKDGLQYAWVDTCCIDKTSSAELSEAINSMFQWYRDAAKCYVYLADYHDEERYRGQKVPFCREVFANSRWFTRGWTLQELLAPSDITFYTSTWAYLGTKKRSVDLLSEITGIDKLALEGWPLHTFSVAERMSWAGDRETSRPEDIAYCLMGIFDVNMPMIYGEGHKAFTRLQEEILKRCEDQTLFAWMASPEDAQRAPYRGLLAKSPSEFKRVLSSAGRMVPFYSVSASPIPVAATSRGIPLTSRVEEVPGSDRKMIFLGLNCHPENSRNHFIEIKLVCLGGDRYLRADPEELAMNETAIARAAAKTATVYVATSVEVSDDELLRQMVPPGIQHSFFIDTMPSEDIAVWSVMPHSGHTVRINGSLGKSGAWIPPERWVDDKTALVFVAPGSNTVLLVVLWVVPQAAGQFIQPFFTAEVRTSEYRQDVEVINNKERPAESVSRRIVSGQFPGPEEKTMAVTIERAKHFGHDVFCLDVTTISAK